MLFLKMFGNKLVQFRACCFKRMSDVCRIGIELGQLGQVGLLIQPVQAVCTQKSKYTQLFCPPEVNLSPFDPSATAETVQPEKSGLSFPSPLPPSLPPLHMAQDSGLILFIFLGTCIAQTSQFWQQIF